MVGFDPKRDVRGVRRQEDDPSVRAQLHQPPAHPREDARITSAREERVFRRQSAAGRLQPPGDAASSWNLSPDAIHALCFGQVGACIPTPPQRLRFRRVLFRVRSSPPRSHGLPGPSRQSGRKVHRRGRKRVPLLPVVLTIISPMGRRLDFDQQTLLKVIPHWATGGRSLAIRIPTCVSFGPPRVSSACSWKNTAIPRTPRIGGLAGCGLLPDCLGWAIFPPKMTKTVSATGSTRRSRPSAAATTYAQHSNATGQEHRNYECQTTE